MTLQGLIRYTAFIIWSKRSRGAVGQYVANFPWQDTAEQWEHMINPRFFHSDVPKFLKEAAIAVGCASLQPSIMRTNELADFTAYLIWATVHHSDPIGWEILAKSWQQITGAAFNSFLKDETTQKYFDDAYQAMAFAKLDL